MSDQKLQRPLDCLHRRLWSARTRRGLSRAAAGAALGMSSKHLQRIENAEREPTVAQVAAAAALYGVETRWLLLGEAPPDAAAQALPVALTELLHRYARAGGAVRPDEPGDAVAELGRDVGLLTAALLSRCAGPDRARTGWSGGAPLPSGGRVSAGYRLEGRPPEALLDRHAAFRAALDWYQRTGGSPQADEAGFLRLLPWLQILVPKPDGSPCLWCGQETPPAAVWGEAVALEMVGKRSLPDTALDRAVNGEFLEVQRTGRPLAQSASGPVTVGGRCHLTHWHRWIAPVRFLGYPAVATLAIFDHDRRQVL